MPNYKFKITNIDCPACIKLSREVLQEIPGVSKIEINNTGEVRLESSREIPWEKIVSALQEVKKSAEKINN
jgi:copper chaperone CopZ